MSLYGFSMIGISDELGLEWLTRMTEPHRHYHTVAHVRDIMSLSRNFCVDGSEAHLLFMATAWLHDIIYDPRSATNEEESAEYARSCLQGSLVDPERVAGMIIDTKAHTATDKLSQMFSDLDMSIVGMPAPIYDDYARKIRLEYDFVPEDVYRAKRAEILEAFDKKTIFYTEECAPLEAKAHENIRREIRSLRN